MTGKSNPKSNLKSLENIAGELATGAAPDDLDRRIAELERWKDRIWRDPQALLKQALELLEQHRELVVVGVTAGIIMLSTFSDADNYDCAISLFC